MCQKLLRDPRFFAFLFKIDQDLFMQAREGRCPFCGGPLHQANYPRKPRGRTLDPPPERVFRFSLCCGSEGCRKRLTPPSVRFLGRKLYLGAVVVLVSAMLHGTTASRLEDLRDLVEVSHRTLDRWRQWWLAAFVKSAFWKASRGRFDTPVDETLLPQSLLDRFLGALRSRALDVLNFLSPITTASAPGSMAF
jgi:hypothetical protein